MTSKYKIIILAVIGIVVLAIAGYFSRNYFYKIFQEEKPTGQTEIEEKAPIDYLSRPDSQRTDDRNLLNELSAPLQQTADYLEFLGEVQ